MSRKRTSSHRRKVIHLFRSCVHAALLASPFVSRASLEQWPSVLTSQAEQVPMELLGNACCCRCRVGSLMDTCGMRVEIGSVCQVVPSSLIGLYVFFRLAIDSQNV
ncbi:uncharacterized protein LAESUDRAFT_447501 [Laetiporus sulphureus 93-53]|uniref:Uncharacterized protein n=1 Tax=Laetiporus sulphureus 93-53 TaxID=1314785 RepID=A0A165BYD6_9APHY|nr:uncharacterized protein LAESUDRAFT_447501 [Laetiporus sulphureus 93-53]KZT01874.1 hypothetical protein LAESUDRAFT_447501 [Laetiporus sulphureus 93-53]